MISNPELIHYACIARSTTILAHHNASNDPNIEALASQCIAQAPPNHSLFSHTLHNRTYTFLIDPPFLFFAIFDHHLLKPQTLSFLHRIRSAFRHHLLALETAAAADDDDQHFPPLCFQPQFDSILRDAVDLDRSNSNSNNSNSSSSRGGSGGDCGNPSSDSVRGKRSAATAPLLGKPAAVEGLKKKKRVVEANGIDGKDGAAMENKVDVCDDVNGGCARDFPLAVAKGAVNDRQKAKHIWKKHVWVVLLLDLFVCAVLFVIWLWVCSGFKCMAY